MSGKVATLAFVGIEARPIEVEVRITVNSGENVGQCYGVKVGHLRCWCPKQEGPACGAFLLSRVVRKVMQNGAPWTV
jgi:hypothetical protein